MGQQAERLAGLSSVHSDLPELAEYVMDSDMTPEERHAVADSLNAIAIEFLRNQTWRDSNDDTDTIADHGPAPAPSHQP